jgi:iron complex transport system ATP-binding protein
MASRPAPTNASAVTTRPLASSAGPSAPEARSVFDIRGLSVRLGGQHVLGPVDLEIRRGAFLGILGPNGSGKTTLLRALTGGVKIAAGEVLLNGRPVRDYRALELARLVGVVPQQFNLDFSFTVAEMVEMGRYAHRRWAGAGPSDTGGSAGGTTPARPAGAGAPPRRAWGRGEAPGRARAVAADGEAVATALAETGLTALAGRPVTELSGGERQRALVAQTLAQGTPILLLDEPLNNLDLNHQLETMQLLARLHDAGRTIAVVLHDLNMAAQYCEELVLLDQGRLAARGQPSDILDPRVILEVFRVRVAVHRQGQRPYITPMWSKARDTSLEPRRSRVHVIAGGGAASELLEELVLRGFAPTVGIVSVFDTDYATAQRYELEVVSAAPFQPFTEGTVRQMQALSEEADVIVVAPVFFGQGNIEPLRVALRAAQAGKTVLFIDPPPIEDRDLTGGEATSLVKECLAAGASAVSGVLQAVERIA